MTVAHTIQGLSANPGLTITRQFDTICRSLLQGPDTVHAPNLFTYITHEPHPFGNFSCISDPTAAHLAEQAIKTLKKVPMPSALLFSAPPPPAIDAMAREHGFALAESMPAMAVDIDTIAHPSLPRGYTFTEITTADGDPAWCEAFATGYGIPLRVATDFGLRAAKNYLNHGEMRFFAITHNNQIVSTSVLYLEGGLAGIYCVSTLTAHRGKGLGACVTAESLRKAREMGYRTGILQSSAMGESVYRRLGFQQFGSMPLYVHVPPGMTATH